MPGPRDNGALSPCRATIYRKGSTAAGACSGPCAVARGELQASSTLSDQRPQPLGRGPRRGFGRPDQQLVRVRCRQRTAEQESLRLLAFVLLEEQELRKALDALRGHVDPQ